MVSNDAIFYNEVEISAFSQEQSHACVFYEHNIYIILVHIKILNQTPDQSGL